MKKPKNLTRGEKSLLLFFETRQVDYGGRVNIDHMNQEDMAIAQKWNKEGFIGFGRIVMRNHNSDGTNWCKLSDEAFELAHKLRLERANRTWENRTWISTKDSREMHGDPHFSNMNNPEKLKSNPHIEEYN